MAEKISFLMECDRNWNITKTIWYQPVYLISPYEKNLLNIFADGDRERLSRLAETALSEDEDKIFDVSFRIRMPEVRVAIFVISNNDRFLVYGQDTSILGRDCMTSACNDIILKFMSSMVKNMDREFTFDNERTIRTQFEQIQKLNNNLLNLQRELKKSNARLNRLNEDLNNRLVKDALTGLVSRYQYREEIELMISKSPERQGIYVFLDVDGFKNINDTYGHSAGDEYLKEFAARMMKIPYDDIICMRIAGDEFGLYIHGYGSVDEADVNELWEKIKKYILKDPVFIGGESLEISCSAGMAVYRRDTVNIYELIEYADFAMYEAKKSGKNRFSNFDMKRYEKSHMMGVEQ